MFIVLLCDILRDTTSSGFSVHAEPQVLYKLPRRSKLEKFEDALLCQSPLVSSYNWSRFLSWPDLNIPGSELLSSTGPHVSLPLWSEALPLGFDCRQLAVSPISWNRRGAAESLLVFKTQVQVLSRPRVLHFYKLHECSLFQVWFLSKEIFNLVKCLGFFW